MMKSNHLSSDSFSVREAALPPPRYDVSDDHAYQPFAARGESLTIPESYEPPSVVRAYIRDFLTRNMATYNLTAADVTRLCQNWQHGTGKELVTYDVKTWRSLMGVEMGSILHSRVQDENASRGFWRDRSYRPMRAFALLVAIEAASVVLTPRCSSRRSCHTHRSRAILQHPHLGRRLLARRFRSHGLVVLPCHGRSIHSLCTLHFGWLDEVQSRSTG